MVSIGVLAPSSNSLLDSTSMRCGLQAGETGLGFCKQGKESSRVFHNVSFIAQRFHEFQRLS